jgi:hypothetical protein
MQFFEASGLLSGLFIFISGIGVAVAGGYIIRSRFHYSILAAGSIAGLIGFTLFLILALSCPFSGSLCISPDPLASVLQVWEHSM